ncbi:MAG TPA: hypothetical protein VEJ20_05775 [Candidatus Eremiobacteraceae bacterium]|nr:hypothetical protein [Candidatus Eremiobacteraceae bacterium]
MDRLRALPFAFALTSCIAICGCHTTASPAPKPPLSNISGDYVGTMNDEDSGNGNATATLAQHGSAVGGAITDVEVSQTITADLALSIDDANNVGGAMVVDYPGGATCSFRTGGTYNPTTNVLNATYTATSGCAGDTGTYSLTQQCTDTPSDVDRQLLGLKPSC